MRIAIIGTGNVGTSLGKGWSAAGHRIVYGSRHPADVDCAVGTADTIPGAAQQADVIVLAVPYTAVAETLAACGQLGNRIVVDATNPMGRPVADGHPSNSHLITASAPGTRVVKAFNSIGAELMANPLFDGLAAAGFVAGDDADARTTVLDLARDLGFEPVDAGGLDAAPLLESLAQLWVHLARSGHGRAVAFALLRR